MAVRLVLILTIAYLSAADRLPICAVRCRLGGLPACAEYNGELMLFLNSCYIFSRYCSTGEEWKEVAMEKCLSAGCPAPCSPETFGFDTNICGTDGSTHIIFKDSCEYLKFACENIDAGWERVEDCQPVTL